MASLNLDFHLNEVWDSRAMKSSYETKLRKMKSGKNVRKKRYTYRVRWVKSS